MPNAHLLNLVDSGYHQSPVQAFEPAPFTSDQYIDLFCVLSSNSWPSSPEAVGQIVNQSNSIFNLSLFGNSAARDIAFGDINHDGLIDLATDKYTYLNQGNGYDPNQVHSLVNGGSYVKTVKFGDYNGDGYSDLLVLESMNHVKLWRSDHGVYHTAPDYFSQEGLVFFDVSRDLEVADLHGLGGKSVLISIDGGYYQSGEGLYQFDPVTVDAVPEPPKYLVINGAVGRHPRVRQRPLRDLRCPGAVGLFHNENLRSRNA